MFDPFSDDDWSASNIPRLRASLRIRGESLDPEFLTQHLGVAPTFSARRGEASEHPDDGIAETGVWSYRLEVPPDTELGEVIEMLLSRFPSDSTLWAELAEAYRIDVFCSVFLQTDNQSTMIDASVLERLARLGLALCFDFYAPFDDPSA
jgi:hypothetical protein